MYFKMKTLDVSINDNEMFPKVLIIQKAACFMIGLNNDSAYAGLGVGSRFYAGIGYHTVHYTVLADLYSTSLSDHTTYPPLAVF